MQAVIATYNTLVETHEKLTDHLNILVAGQIDPSAIIANFEQFTQAQNTLGDQLEELLTKAEQAGEVDALKLQLAWLPKYQAEANKVEPLEEKVAELEAQLTVNAKALGQAEEHIEELLDMHKTLVAQRDGYNTQAGQLAAKLQAVNSEMSALKKLGDVKTIARQNSKLREDRDKLKKEKTSLNQRIKRYRDENLQLQKMKEDAGILTCYIHEGTGQILRMVPRVRLKPGNDLGGVPDLPAVECYYPAKGVMRQGFLCDDGTIGWSNFSEVGMPEHEVSVAAINRILEFAKRHNVKVPKDVKAAAKANML